MKARLANSLALRARPPLVAALLATATLGLGTSGCGGNEAAPPGMPMALLGTYDVSVESEGHTDTAAMDVVAGSNNGVVLTFNVGLGAIRCTVQGSTSVTIPRQAIEADHATGLAKGQASGAGEIAADGKVDIKFTLVTAGITETRDGGSTSSSIPYHITGTRHKS